MNTARDQWTQMAQTLSALRAQQASVHDLVQLARAQTTLRDALPPRFGPVLDGLLDRMEASALFTEESCSFSQRDLLDSLQLWLDKASEHLA